MLYNPPQGREPRASRIPLPDRFHVATQVWMGGADALHGEALDLAGLADAWIIDLAGDMPLPHREAAALWLPRVFLDIESRPSNLERLTELARSMAAVMRGLPWEGDRAHPHEPPGRVFVMCQHGLNRSGLVTGLILRALGLTADETIAAIASRPGALNNQAFVALLREYATE